MTSRELRNSILRLAIEGKLVPQDSAEGTGEELYRKIQVEKNALVKAGKGKKQKPLPEITDDEIPFNIPDSWKWVRSGSVFQLFDGDKICGRKHPYLEAKFLRGKISASIIDSGKFARKGDKVILVDGENSGEVFTLPQDGYMGSTFKKLFIPASMFSKYAEYFLLFHKEDYRNNKKGAAIPHLNKALFFSTPIPLPPLAEQKRIVAKLSELLPLVDRYGAAQDRLEEIDRRFPADMRKAILRQAVEGKLVPQDPAEGTGEELYQKIQAEKNALAKAGKRKKQKPLPEITDDEIPFDIPDSWKWVRLGNCILVARGGSPRPIKSYLTNSKNGINWIKIGDSEIGGKYINSTKEKIIPEGMKKSRFVHKGDFLLSNSMSFGRPYILNVDGCIHDGWLVLGHYEKVFDKNYLYYLLSSSMVFRQFCNRVAGAVVNNLNSDKVAITLIPLPPLAEQKRIVAKIEELLPLVDRLS